MGPELRSLKDWAKTGSGWLFSALIVPVIVSYRFHLRLTLNCNYRRYGRFLAPIPGLIGREIRQAFYRNTLRRCGRNLKVGFGSLFTSPDTEVGDNVTMGAYCTIGPCRIGSDVAMASHIVIQPPLREGVAERPSLTGSPIYIGDLTWIGEGARVAASVGDKSIVGVGAVVKHTIPDAVIVFGDPARVISQRSAPLRRSPSAAT